jgi:hypothetical protein
MWRSFRFLTEKRGGLTASKETSMHAKKATISLLMIPLALTTAFTAPSSEASQAIAASRTAGIADISSCENWDMVFRARSDFPNTAIGEVNYNLQSSKMQAAVVCIVNRLRAYYNTTGGVQRPPVTSPLILYRPGTPPPPRGLGGAAYDHATAAATLRWWGTVAQYPTCTPRVDNPSTSENESLRCDPHINPQTKSTPAKRAEEQGFGKGCTRWKVGENVYTGWGAVDRVRPVDAVGWWMNSPPHAATILDPDYNVMYLRVVLGSADPSAGTSTPAATYVQMFGRCWK